MSTRNATGVHAGAITRAQKRGDAWLADAVYSGGAGGEFGKSQQIGIGHMNGMSNVRYWLEQRGIPCQEALCQEILQRAKTCGECRVVEIPRANHYNLSRGKWDGLNDAIFEFCASVSDRN
jgi:hypothetical protein